MPDKRETFAAIQNLRAGAEALRVMGRTADARTVEGIADDVGIGIYGKDATHMAKKIFDTRDDTDRYNKKQPIPKVKPCKKSISSGTKK